MRRGDHRGRALGLAALLAAGGVPAAEPEPPAAWRCAACPAPAGLELDTELGGGYVSDDSFRFGDYTGLDEAGGFWVGGLRGRYAAGDDTRWRVDARDLGLDVREVDIAGGRQGRYELRLGYRELPHRVFESGASPYERAGGPSLGLPSGWVTAPGTAGLSALADSLRPVEIGTDRETASLGFSVLSSPRLRYDFDYRHQQRDGTALWGGSFLAQAAELPRPVDDVTQTVDAGVSYAADTWHARLGYFGSFYSNDAASLAWDNPFDPLAPGAARGQAALEPDNRFQQLLLSGQYHGLPRAAVSGSLALGRAEQDDTLLPFSATPGLGAALPRRTLDATLDTFHADARLLARPTGRTRLRAELTHDRRDNDTPQEAWSYVVTDVVPGDPRVNLPYGYERSRFGLEGEYRLPTGVTAELGWNRRVNERDFQEVGRDEEDEFHGQLRLRLDGGAELSARYAHANRDASDYRPVPALQPRQNPLLRKYNLADRERESLSLRLWFQPTERLDVGLTAELAEDDYTDSALGLVEAEEQAVNLDASLALPAQMSLAAHAGIERLEAVQLGSQSFGAADWQADSEDRSLFAGLSLHAPELTERLGARLAWSWTDTRGEIELDTSGLVQDFPALDTSRRRVELELDYALRDDLSVRLGWVFEDYDVDDWTRAGVAPDTLPAVLGTGAQWLGYDVNVLLLSATWRLAAR